MRHIKDRSKLYRAQQELRDLLKAMRTTKWQQSWHADRNAKSTKLSDPYTSEWFKRKLQEEIEITRVKIKTLK